MTKKPATHPKRTHPPSVRLINGMFSRDEARHLLLSLITYKISFHEVKNFGDTERYGRQDRHVVRRIGELRKSGWKLRRFLDALDADVRMRIETSVKIRVVKDPPGARRPRRRSLSRARPKD